MSSARLRVDGKAIRVRRLTAWVVIRATCTPSGSVSALTSAIRSVDSLKSRNLSAPTERQRSRFSAPLSAPGSSPTLLVA